MLDPLSLLFAVVLAFQGGTVESGYTDNTRAVIIDTGSPSQESPPPPDDARSQIVDIG